MVVGSNVVGDDVDDEIAVGALGVVLVNLSKLLAEMLLDNLWVDQTLLVQILWDYL